MTLQEVELENKIIFPMLFKKIYYTGAIEWLEKSNSYICEHYDELVEKNYFAIRCLGDCRFIPFECISETLIELKEMIDMDAEFSGDELIINPKYRVLPFAKMFSGDIYCFVYENDVEEPIIVVYGHDTGDWDLWAPDFETFVFGQIISSVIYWDDYIDSEYILKQISFLKDEYKSRLIGKSIEELKKEDEQLMDIIPFDIYL